MKTQENETSPAASMGADLYRARHVAKSSDDEKVELREGYRLRCTNSVFFTCAK